jgi:hypothetical protein
LSNDRQYTERTSFLQGTLEDSLQTDYLFALVLAAPVLGFAFFFLVAEFRIPCTICGRKDVFPPPDHCNNGSKRPKRNT